MSRRQNIVPASKGAAPDMGSKRSVMKYVMLCVYVLVVGIAIGGLWGSITGDADKPVIAAITADHQAVPEAAATVASPQPPLQTNVDELAVHAAVPLGPKTVSATVKESVREYVLPLPPLRRPKSPNWQRYAVLSDGRVDEPKVALVIDDMGMARSLSHDMASLPGPLTLSYLPYADGLPQQTEYAWSRGHELMVHLPMEPKSKTIDPGPSALLTDMGSRELATSIAYNLNRFRGYVGINNHMGSLFTEQKDVMRPVFEAMAEKGVFFLDSRTSRNSVGAALAAEYDVPVLERDIFLDNSRDPDAIRHQLDKLESIARRRGEAIAIAHPYPETVAVLTQWLSELEGKGIKLVPLSRLVSLRYGMGSPQLAQQSQP